MGKGITENVICYPAYFNISMAEYSAQVENKLKALTLSPEAAHWVMKALDPVRSSPCQMPDAVQVAALVPEYRASVVISAPPALTSPTWDCCIVLPPSDLIGAMIATGNAGIDFSNSVALTNTTLPNASPAYAPNSSIRGAGLSTVTGLATGAGDFRALYSSEYPAMWRTTARSATVYATGSDLYNQGTVYSGQYSRKTTRTFGQAVDPSVGQFYVDQIEVVDIPLREQDMAVITPGNTYYTASAREGVYTVHRMCGPAQEFVVPAAPTCWRSPDGLTMYQNLTDPTNYSGTTCSVARFRGDSYTYLSPNFPPTGLGFSSTSFDQNTSWGVVIFRGLHPLMTLTLKTYTNLEIVPSVNAPSRQFVKPPIKFEPTAMAAYYAIAAELPSSMPSKFNFLGAILPAISAIASKVLPFLAPIAGQALTGLASKLIGAPEPQQAAPSAAAAGRRRSASVHSTRSRASSVRSRGVKVSKSKRKVRIARRR